RLAVTWPPHDMQGSIELRSMADPTAPGQRIAAPKGDLGTRSYSDGVLSPDGTKLAFLDAAPFAGGGVDLVVRAGAPAGPPEPLRLTLPTGAAPTFLDYDGRFVVVSTRFGWPPLVLDTAEATPTWRQISGVTGTVTIDRF